MTFDVPTPTHESSFEANDIQSKLLSASVAGDTVTLSQLYTTATSCSPPSHVPVQELALRSAQANQPESLAFWLAHGARPRAHPLIFAAFEQPDLLPTLFDAGLDPDSSLSYQGSLLACAAFFGRLGAVEEILARGASTENPAKYEGRWTPIEAAVAGKAEGRAEVVRMLLEAGAKVNGSAAMRLAVNRSDLEVVSALVEGGANVNEMLRKSRSNELGTALHLARKKEDVELERLLEDAGGLDNGPSQGD